ncbi:MAG: hypothetical protein EB164_09675 [Thaumarchaeota archaeon]|nr:hypothetical protein [Nitrososphaerota archaeon]
MSNKNYIAHGYKGINLPQPDWSIQDNGRGLLEGNAKIFFTHSKNVVPSGLPVRGSSHPYDSRLHCHTSNMTLQKNGIGYCEAQYIGIKEGDTTVPEWTLSANTSDLSIQLHKSFNDWCVEGGLIMKPDGNYNTSGIKSGKNGYKMVEVDENGKFERFGLSHPKVKGVETFSVPQGNCKVSFYCKNKEQWYAFSVGGLAKWCTKPPFVPDFLDASSANLSWLLNGSSVTEYGNIYKVELDFLLSILGEPVNPYVYQKLNI